MSEVAFALSVLVPLLIQRYKKRLQNEDKPIAFLRPIWYALFIAALNITRISTVSAPGKILIAGGYLVLEHPNAGITISATARFHTTVQLDEVVSPLSSVPM
jgi:hypothetical protein